MKTIKIGKENATFQEVVALKENRTKRQQKKMFFVEGVQNIKEAINNDYEIYAFIVSDDCKLSDWAKSILARAEFCYVLTKELVQKLSDKSDTSEILALVRFKQVERLNLSKNPLLVLLDRPSKKGNLGTIIRSCDALNVEHIFIMGHAVDVYDPQVITSSMGSFFKLNITEVGSFQQYEELIIKFRNKYKDFQVVGTSLKTDKSLSDCDFKKPTLLLVGNENSGLSKNLSESADNLLRINMKKGVDSLNVACATSIFLYEIDRQRNCQ